MCPIYEYECEKCGVFEVLQGIKEPDLTECPNCICRPASLPVRKILSTSSFSFVGSGFYCVDYKNKQEPKKKDK